MGTNDDPIIDDRALLSLRPLIRNWRAATRRFIEAEERYDYPWAYNERASISLLAGAAWITGGTALEEFVSKKKSAMKEKRPGKAHGRIDLYFSIPNKEGKSLTSYACEAKFVEIGLAGPQRHMKIRDAWERSITDTEKLTSGEADHRLAITFISIQSLTKSIMSYGDLSAKFKDLLADIRRRHKPGLLGHYLAGEKELPIDPTLLYRFPGGIIMMKSIITR